MRNKLGKQIMASAVAATMAFSLVVPTFAAGSEYSKTPVTYSSSSDLDTLFNSSIFENAIKMIKDLLSGWFKK